MPTSLYDLIAYPQHPPSGSGSRSNTSATHPPPSTSSSPYATEEKIRQLVNEFKDKSELSEDERMWLSRECFVRFLTATKGDIPTTLTRIQKCLAFRSSWSLYSIPTMYTHVTPESPCGKEFVLGYSSKGQPVLYFYPNRSDTEVGERQMRHTVYMMERTIDLMPPGISNLCLIIDLAGKSRAPTSVAQAKLFVEILGNHYPERLGTAVILNLPWMVKKFLDMIFKFVDPVTKAKVSWESSFVKDGLIPKSTALKDHGGDLPFVYNHDEYWPTLFDVSMEKREAYKSAWRSLGGTVGISEYDYKSIHPTSVGPPQQPQHGTRQPTPTKGLMSGPPAASVPVSDQTPRSAGTSVSSAFSDGATLHEAHGMGDGVQEGKIQSSSYSTTVQPPNPAMTVAAQGTA